MLFEQLLVDSRLVVEAFEKGGRGHFDEVLEAPTVFGQQRQVKAGLFHPGRVFVRAAARGDIGFVSQNRVDPLALWPRNKLQRPVQVPVVGDGQGVHPRLFGLLDQVGNAVGAVEQAVMRVAMQVHEGA